MYSRLIPDLLSCLRSMRPLSRRSRRNRSGLFIPEHLEKRELLSVTPVLVADINGATASGLDAPELPLFGYVNGVTVFVEYRSDGSSRLVSTRFSTELNPGIGKIIHEFSQRTDLNGTSFTDSLGTLYFRAVDSLTGDELWKTDGTAAGTQRVWSLGIQPGTCSFRRLDLRTRETARFGGPTGQAAGRDRSTAQQGWKLIIRH